VKLGVVIPCYRQERRLPRTLAAIDAALAGHDWRGALVIAAAGDPLPPLGERWRLIAPPVTAPLTPGAARMLGFSACGGEWVLFVDADVEVDAEWAARAIAMAEAARPGDHALAGLGGRLEEWFEDANGVRRGSSDMYGVGESDRDVAYLATLAFYSREGLTRAGGYDARLQSEEDFELGLRFARLALRLRSLGMRAARHWSAPRPSFAELGRRWRTGLCFGQGQVLRLYLGRPGFRTLLRRQALYLATLGLWTLGLASAVWAADARDARPVLAWCAAPLAVLALMAARKRSVRLALHSLLSWTLNGAGLVVGLFRSPSRASLGAGEPA
jgi:hypothetical protein